MPDNRLSIRNLLFRVAMPYCFHKIDAPGAKDVYLPLNRNYKPLGYAGPQGSSLSSWVDYKDYLHQAVVFSRDPSTFEGIWTKTTPFLYLYSDSSATQATYFQRLEKLMSRTIGLYAYPDPDNDDAVIATGAAAMRARLQFQQSGSRLS
jgi:hypothetical protein